MSLKPKAISLWFRRRQPVGQWLTAAIHVANPCCSCKLTPPPGSHGQRKIAATIDIAAAAAAAAAASAANPTRACLGAAQRPKKHLLMNHEKV